MDMPKIGIALGSGGARGFAHLGVLKALQDNSIPVNMIAGSSMGALVGCFYAFGHDLEQLIKLSTAFKRKYYLDFIVPKMGFIAGNRVKNLIGLFMQGKNLEELNIPVSVIATDLQSGEKVEFMKGPIAEIVRASIAIPGIFTPEKFNGRLLVDGGVADRVPVSTVKKMGADIVIGSDVARVNPKAEISTVYDVIMQSLDILQMEIGEAREFESDVMIRPHVEIFSARAFKNIEEIIHAGEEETLKKISEIKHVIEQYTNKESKSKPS
ncbi:patatin-like phospholipase family protein [Lederbergia citrea]|uniref:Patatin-like phospholipase family protein n=1 Tax=Lederbergia citrea TaxID=2833581 RepID=A0A942Z2I9_9BACI|nr:patatin-like phospholipase family protein [Lederbergia citrea]MBS4177233.1 patatin-like phospholipase family protein [Lederbergia citrea]MBS4203896.1 patatin-like phospholipase family protein [Lederbergia citrea]MBS4221519.1 patatin-like phospholipase family protein [Lederbergia citrea]